MFSALAAVAVINEVNGLGHIEYDFGSLLPIDQFVPLSHEAADIFRHILIGFPNGDRIFAVAVLRDFWNE